MRAAVLLLLPLLAACGPSPDQAGPAVRSSADSSGETAKGGAASTPSPADGAQLLAAVPRSAERAGSVRYTAVSEGGVDGEPSEVEARLSGVLDLAVGAGTGTLDLVGLDELAADAQAGGDPSAAADLGGLAVARLAWTATDVTVFIGDQQETAPRNDADSSVLARVPGEPAGLFDVVAAATDVTVVGRRDVDGEPTTYLRASAQPKAAVDAGLGTQAQLSIARLPVLPVEVWVDDEGRPARIRYSVALPSLQPGRTRTLVTTYDYRAWGEPVDATTP